MSSGSSRSPRRRRRRTSGSRARKASAPVVELSFAEIDPTHSTDQFRRKIRRALELLRDSTAAVGRATYLLIARGEVRLDALSDLTRGDFVRVRRELGGVGIELHATAHAEIRDGRRQASRLLDAAMCGWAWDERLYVSVDPAPRQIARALVHEVNHFLNASEEHYRGHRARLLEEYRAFYAERLFLGHEMTREKCRRLKRLIIKDYELEGVTVDDVPDHPPGRFVRPLHRASRRRPRGASPPAG